MSRKMKSATFLPDRYTQAAQSALNNNTAVENTVEYWFQLKYLQSTNVRKNKF